MWYIVYIKGGCEAKVCTSLIKNGMDAFVPKREKFHRIDGEMVKVIKDLFPNYVFINTDLDYIAFSEQFNHLKVTDKNLIKQLRYDLVGTSPLNKEEEVMLEKLLGKNKILETSIGFIEDERVCITEGPLMGFESHIVWINRHKREAKLSLNLMGSQRDVSVSLDILTKI